MDTLQPIHLKSTEGQLSILTLLVRPVMVIASCRQRSATATAFANTVPTPNPRAQHTSSLPSPPPPPPFPPSFSCSAYRKQTSRSLWPETGYRMIWCCLGGELAVRLPILYDTAHVFSSIVDEIQLYHLFEREFSSVMDCISSLATKDVKGGSMLL